MSGSFVPGWLPTGWKRGDKLQVINPNFRHGSMMRLHNVAAHDDAMRRLGRSGLPGKHGDGRVSLQQSRASSRVVAVVLLC